MSIPIAEYTIPLDYADKTNPSVPNIEIPKADTGTRKFNITLKNKKVAIDLTDLTPRIYFHKPDGNRTQGDPTVVSAETGQISYTLKTNDVAKEGQVTCQITLNNVSGDRITTFAFDFNVLPTAYDDSAVHSTNEFTILTEYADNLRHRGEYAAGTEYYVNNIVTYNGSSYIALQTTSGNTPPTYPDLYNDYWYVIANGTGTTASGISIEDSRGYYAAGRNFTTPDGISDVEAALKDLGAFKRLVPETGWTYYDASDPIVVLKKLKTEYSMITNIYEGGIGCFAYLYGAYDGDIGSIEGVVVDVFSDGTYYYAAIYCGTDGGTGTSGPLLDADDVLTEVAFAPALAVPVRFNHFLDPEKWTMQWSLNAGTGVSITPSATWQEIDSNLRATIPAYGDYFVKIDVPIGLEGIDGTGILVNVTNDVSTPGSIDPLSGKLGANFKTSGDGNTSMTHNVMYQKTFLISGTGTPQTLSIIAFGVGATNAHLAVGGVVDGYIQVWPACIPVMGGVAI